MGPNSFILIENIAYVMPRGTTCAVTCKPATLIIRGMPGITYGCAVWPSHTIFIKINCLTFWHPKYEICKPECAGKDSRCHAQQEQDQLQ